MRRPLGLIPQPPPGGRNFRDWRLPASRRQTANGGRVMSDRATESGLPIPFRRALSRDRSDQQDHRCAGGRIAGRSGARTGVVCRRKMSLSQRQVMLTQEFEHRLINGLQLIVSLLSLQSRTATTPEAADQLTIAARRVAALGRVHRRLHLLDHQDHVEFKEYLQHLCEDLSGLLFAGRQRLRHRGRGRQCRDPDHHGDSARLHRQRADHQFGEIRRGPRHRSDRSDIADRSFAVGHG